MVEDALTNPTAAERTQARTIARLTDGAIGLLCERIDT